MGELTRRQKTTFMGERNFITQKSRDHDMHMLPNLGIKFPRPLSFKPMFSLDALRALCSKKKHFA